MTEEQSKRVPTTKHHDFKVKRKYFVVWLGAPGLYDKRDPVHDKAWSNYVSYIMNEAKGGHLSKDERHLWVLYRPGYDARWADDTRRPGWWSIRDSDLLRTRNTHVESVRQRGGENYIDHVSKRAGGYSSDYGIEISVQTGATSDEFWHAIRNLPDGMLSRLWFFGHARDDLWLTLKHNENGVAVRPELSAVIAKSDISIHAPALKPKFSKNPKPCKFYGCNTSSFAFAWHQAFSVPAEGADGTITFGQGGFSPTALERTATKNWQTYGGTVP